MKKKEWIIIAVIAVVSALLIFVPKLKTSSASTVDDSTETEHNDTGTDDGGHTSDGGENHSDSHAAIQLVDVVHNNETVLRFDPSIDAVYHISGDVGGLDVEVKDGKWHVINEQCPNHICANMGWVGVDDMIPITCIPNDIYILPED